jgi:hypothetical protein
VKPATTFLRFAFPFLALSALAAACAANSDTGIGDIDAGDAVDAGSAYDNYVAPPYDSGANQPDSNGGGCSITCGGDLECQNSCPATSMGIYCCDKATSMCYVSPGTMCPAPVDSGGMTD